MKGTPNSAGKALKQAVRDMKSEGIMPSNLIATRPRKLSLQPVKN